NPGSTARWGPSVRGAASGALDNSRGLGRSDPFRSYHGAVLPLCRVPTIRLGAARTVVELTAWQRRGQRDKQIVMVSGSVSVWAGRKHAGRGAVSRAMAPSRSFSD